MVAKKKSTAVAKRKSAAQLAPLQNNALLERFKAKLPSISASHWISAKGGRFSFADNDLGTSIEVVVLNYCYENSLYLKPYDPDNIEPPSCFAVSEGQSGMCPHENVPEPVSDACAQCEYNQFGSAENGKGKACNNVMRLAVVHVDDVEDPQAQVLFVRISASAITKMGEYLNNLDKVLNAVPFQVVTRLTIEPLPMGFAIFPEAAGYTDESSYGNLEKLMDANTEALVSPPQIDAVPKADKPAKKKAAGKKKAAARRRKF